MNNQEIEKAIIELNVLLDAGISGVDMDIYGFISEESFRAAISALQQQLTNGWIPVSSRLPNKSDSYTVTKKCENEEGFTYEICTEIFWTNDNKWDSERDEICEWKVVAWKKEEPYKELN